MIYGLTNEERQARVARKNAKLMKWHRHFLWLPLDYGDGQFIRFEFVQRRAEAKERHLGHGGIISSKIVEKELGSGHQSVGNDNVAWHYRFPKRDLEVWTG